MVPDPTETVTIAIGFSGPVLNPTLKEAKKLKRTETKYVTLSWSAGALIVRAVGIGGIEATCFLKI
jgi:hypothetical protein